MRKAAVTELDHLRSTASAARKRTIQQVEAVLRTQTDVILSMGREALRDLTSEELFWRPAPTSWSLHQSDTGWVADWVEPEPAELPPPTPAWQLWHCCLWLSMVIDHSFGSRRLTRDAFDWAGPDAGLEPIFELHDRWRERCRNLGLARWDDGDPRARRVVPVAGDQLSARLAWTEH